MTIKKLAIYLILIFFLFALYSAYKTMIVYEASMRVEIGYSGSAISLKNNTVNTYDFIEAANDLVFFINNTYENVTGFNAPGYGKYVIVKSVCKDKEMCLNNLIFLTNNIIKRHNSLIKEKLSFLNSEKVIIESMIKELKKIKTKDKHVANNINEYINSRERHLKDIDFILTNQTKTLVQEIITKENFLYLSNYYPIAVLLFLLMVYHITTLYIVRSEKVKSFQLLKKRQLIIAVVLLVSVAIFIQLSHVKPNAIYKGFLKFDIGHTGKKTTFYNGIAKYYNFLETTESLQKYVNNNFKNISILGAPNNNKLFLVSTVCIEKKKCKEDLENFKLETLNFFENSLNYIVKRAIDKKFFLLSNNGNSKNNMFIYDNYNEKHLNNIKLPLEKILILLNTIVRTSFGEIIIIKNDSGRLIN